MKRRLDNAAKYFAIGLVAWVSVALMQGCAKMKAEARKEAAKIEGQTNGVPVSVTQLLAGLKTRWESETNATARANLAVEIANLEKFIANK